MTVNVTEWIPQIKIITLAFHTEGDCAGSFQAKINTAIQHIQIQPDLKFDRVEVTTTAKGETDWIQGTAIIHYKMLRSYDKGLASREAEALHGTKDDNQRPNDKS